MENFQILISYIFQSRQSISLISFAARMIHFPVKTSYRMINACLKVKVNSDATARKKVACATHATHSAMDSPPIT